MFPTELLASNLAPCLTRHSTISMQPFIQASIRGVRCEEPYGMSISEQ